MTAEPLTPEEERLLRFSRSIGGAPISYGPVDAVDRLLATLDAARAAHAPIAGADTGLTDDPDYYPNTDYERGFADGRESAGSGLDVERLARAYAEAGYGPALSDDEWADIAREYAALRDTDGQRRTEGGEVDG